MDLLDRLTGHDRWGTVQLLDRSRALSEAQLDQPFDIGHASVRATFVHLIENIEFWTTTMTGEKYAWTGESGTIDILAERHERAYDRFATFARKMYDEGRFDETFIDHYGQPMTYGGATVHVVLHNAEHRAEIVHILVRLGIGEPPEVDHGLWDFVSRGLFS